MIDQTLIIRNDSGTTLAPVLELRALNREGEVLDDVTVSAMFGSDRGLLVVAPGSTFDVLVFKGPGRRLEVVDVAVEVAEVEELDGGARGSLLEVAPLDGDAPVTPSDPFDAIRVSNGNAVAVAARVVFLVYDIPTEGQSQQVEEFIVLADGLPLGPGEAIELPVSSDLAAEIAEAQASSPVSLKVHLTPPAADPADPA